MRFRRARHDWPRRPCSSRLPFFFRCVCLLRLARRCLHFRRRTTGTPRRLGPAAGAVAWMMEDFPVRDRMIALSLEVFVQRDDARRVLLRIGQMRDEPFWRGPDARHQARARRTARGHHAISAIEEQSLRGEPIDVRRLDAFDAVAAQLGAQIVHGDEQDVRPVRGAQADANNRDKRNAGEAKESGTGWCHCGKESVRLTGRRLFGTMPVDWFENSFTGWQLGTRRPRRAGDASRRRRP